MADVNMQPFFQRLLRGACRCAVLGDSINVPVGVSWTSMMYGYERMLRPTTWRGVFSAASTTGMDAEVTNLPALYDTVGCGSGFGTVPVLDGDGGAVAGEDKRWPTYYGNGRFATAAGALAWGSTISRWNFSAARRAAFQGGDFLTGAATCRVVLDRGSVGISKISAYSTRGGGSFTPLDNVALAAGNNTLDIPIAAGAGDTLCELLASGPGGNDIDERGLNLFLKGFRHEADGVSGLTIGTLGIGGATVSDLAGTAICTDADIADFVAIYQIDTIMINIGTNDGVWDASHYAFLLTLIGRWRTAITNAGRVFKCLLISPYPQALSDNTTMGPYMAQACGVNSDTSFWDQNAVCGSRAFMLANGDLAADNTHPGPSGALRLAGLLNSAGEESLLGRHAPPLFVRQAIAAGKTVIRPRR